MTPSQQTPAVPSQSVPAEFPVEELDKYRGRWLAFSPDGSRLIANAATLASLDSQLRALGENPQEVLLGARPG